MDNRENISNRMVPVSFESTWYKYVFCELFLLNINKIYVIHVLRLSKVNFYYFYILIISVKGLSSWLRFLMHSWHCL